MTTDPHYVIRGGDFGRERLRLLTRTLAPATGDLLLRAGLAEGMSCLDLGCGAGDVARDIAERVGASGRVLGIDIDASKVAMGRQELASIPNVTLRHGDVRDLSDTGQYDLAYIRFLLTYLPDRDDVLARVLGALKPGGIVVVEDIDFSAHFCHPPSPAFTFYVRLFSDVVRRKGGDPDVGPTLPALLLRAGFDAVQASVTQPAFLSGEGKQIAALTLDGISESVLAERLAEPAPLAAAVRELEALARDASTLMSMPRIVQAWGRKPAPSP